MKTMKELLEEVLVEEATSTPEQLSKSIMTGINVLKSLSNLVPSTEKSITWDMFKALISKSKEFKKSGKNVADFKYLVKSDSTPEQLSKNIMSGINILKSFSNLVPSTEKNITWDMFKALISKSKEFKKSGKNVADFKYLI